jgi:hypothetical protein
MIFFLFLLSVIVMQRILAAAAEIPKRKAPEPPLAGALSSPHTALISPDITEYHLPVSLIHLSNALEQHAPAAADPLALKNTAP